MLKLMFLVAFVIVLACEIDQFNCQPETASFDDMISDQDLTDQLDTRSMSPFIRNQKAYAPNTSGVSEALQKRVMLDPIDRYIFLYVLYARTLNEKVYISPSQSYALKKNMNVLENILKKYAMSNKTNRQKVLSMLNSVKQIGV